MTDFVTGEEAMDEYGLSLEQLHEIDLLYGRIPENEQQSRRRNYRAYNVKRIFAEQYGAPPHNKNPRSVVLAHNRKVKHECLLRERYPDAEQLLEVPNIQRLVRGKIWPGSISRRVRQARAQYQRMCAFRILCAHYDATPDQQVMHWCTARRQRLRPVVQLLAKRDRFRALLVARSDQAYRSNWRAHDGAWLAEKAAAFRLKTVPKLAGRPLALLEAEAYGFLLDAVAESTRPPINIEDSLELLALRVICAEGLVHRVPPCVAHLITRYGA